VAPQGKGRHVAGKHNVVADMLSRARYNGHEDRHCDEEDVGLDFFTSSYARVLSIFVEEEYEGKIRGDRKVLEYSSMG
jgi:hypothetical protein